MPDNNAFFFKINQTKFANIAGQNVMTCISLGKGINAEKNIASEEELHIEFLKQLNKHHPFSDTILVGGSLARWNFWEMIREIDDNELAHILKDIPKNTNEKELATKLAEKFSYIATSLEGKYIQKLENYLQENKEALRDISFRSRFKILPWDQREKYANFTKKLSDEEKIPKSNESKKFIEDTIKRFLQNKEKHLIIAKERLTKVIPELVNLNFDKLVNRACKEFIREEYEYFSSLSNTQLFYNGLIPAFNPILKGKNNNVTWHTYQFKHGKKPQEELKITTSSLIHKKLSLPPLNQALPSESKFNGDFLELKEPSPTFIDTSMLSPRSSKRLKTFFDHYINNLTSASKELIDRKIEEATTFLSMN